MTTSTEATPKTSITSRPNNPLRVDQDLIQTQAAKLNNFCPGKTVLQV